MPSLSFNQLEIQASLEYWTPERMANARPAPLLHIEMPERSQQKYDVFSKAEAEMSFCAARDEEYEHVPVDAPPNKRAGRLYYKTPDGEDLYATAQFVGARNMLLTAAHCLKIPGRKEDGWSTNLIFERSKNGQQYKNTVIALQTANVPDAWDESCGNGKSQVRWDYGFVRTTAMTNRGQFTLSLSFPLAIRAIGYPKNGGNKQQYMCYIDGVRGDDLNGYCCMYGNYMDEGAAGGGWLAYKYEKNFIYGINAANDDTGLMYGPIFDENVFILFNKVLVAPLVRKVNFF